MSLTLLNPPPAPSDILLRKLIARKIIHNYPTTLLDLVFRLRCEDLSLDEFEQELIRLEKNEEKWLTPEERRSVLATKILVCVYCENPVLRERPSCCKEYGHTKEIEVPA